MNVDQTKSTTERMFNGILSGSGDIYRRMVNGIGIEPAYPNGLEDIVPKLYSAFNSGQIAEGKKLADEFLISATFLDEDEDEDE
jgi:hypothetical protein